VILLDTHAALWFASESSQLGKEADAVATAALADARLAVSAISAWEIALLVSKRRLGFTESAETVWNEFIAGGIIELPLTSEIALLSVALANLHPDPADRFIVATAIVHDATLVTADKALLRWRHTLKRQDAAK
jgi:PIN domain nuclease of toxin-antitoxin system